MLTLLTLLKLVGRSARGGPRNLGELLGAVMGFVGDKN